MITLFTLPKPFVGHIGMIQRNAIQSWTRLHPDIDILMFGSEQGTAEIAAEFGIRHFPDVDVNEYGTPRMSGYFQSSSRAGGRGIEHRAHRGGGLLADDEVRA